MELASLAAWGGFRSLPRFAGHSQAPLWCDSRSMGCDSASESGSGRVTESPFGRFAHMERGFMNFFTPAAEVRPHLKAMFMGDFDTGKTFNTFFFPFPLAGFEVESGLQAYLDRVKFDMKKIYRIQELNDGLQMLTETDEGKAYLGNYRTIAIDGISKLWHDEMKRLRGDRDSLEFEDMS